MLGTNETPECVTMIVIQIISIKSVEVVNRSRLIVNKKLSKGKRLAHVFNLNSRTSGLV